ncbi:regulator of chromosome condensation (RCC1) family protein [Actinidia rufa]|uniref:Regulator of chromosome condensation (RCC1) family protein n=1 Tax=Actinidia rufa TaxID=165716 RepID=A0A7J0EY02_9ERIC|nr:regulator of chromosome condensation (RCC1) family protein [Actinidia rufa]
MNGIESVPRNVDDEMLRTRHEVDHSQKWKLRVRVSVEEMDFEQRRAIEQREAVRGSVGQWRLRQIRARKLGFAVAACFLLIFWWRGPPWHCLWWCSYPLLDRFSIASSF